MAIERTLFQRIASFCGRKRIFVILIGMLIVCTTVSSWVFQNTWGLVKTYYENLEWSGVPAHTEIDQIDQKLRLIDLQGENTPASDIFSVKWTGWIAIEQPGAYRFATESDDGSFLSIAHQVVVDNGGLHGLQRVSRVIELAKGMYPIEIAYIQGGGYSVLKILWTPPGGKEQFIPARHLFANKPTSIEYFFRKTVFQMLWGLRIVWAGFFLGLLGGLVISFRHPLYVIFSSDVVWIALLCSLAFWISATSPNHYGDSDPAGTLVTSQIIIQDGTLQADPYVEAGIPGAWHREEHTGHYYDYYPIGTALYMAPFVYIANRFGSDMLNSEDNVTLLKRLAGGTVALTCLLCYLLSRCYTHRFYSVLYTIAFGFGSPMMSTMGTAVWSVNLVVIFMLLSLLLLIHRRFSGSRWAPYLLGFLLFSAYLCRPTAVLFLAGLFGFLLLNRRRAFWPALAVFLLFLALLVVFSFREYHQPLPDYYLPSRLSESGDFATALYGTMLSPSRGLLVFSPYLVLTIAGVCYAWKRLVRNHLLVMLGISMILHWIIIALELNSVWYGGACFGARLFTDVFPALLLITLSLTQVINNLPTVPRRILVGAYLVLTACAVFINTYQGMYNKHSKHWNIFLTRWNIACYLDWKYPQFLASEELLIRRNNAYADQ